MISWEQELGHSLLPFINLRRCSRCSRRNNTYQRNPTIFRHSWPEWRYTQIYWYHLISSDILKWNKQLPCQGTKDIPQQWLHLWFHFPRRLHLQELHRGFSRIPRVTVIHGTRQKHHTRNTSFARLFVKEKHVAKHTKKQNNAVEWKLVRKIQGWIQEVIRGNRLLTVTDWMRNKDKIQTKIFDN